MGTIDSLTTETEELKQKLYKAIAESTQVIETKDNKIVQLNKNIETLKEKVGSCEEELEASKVTVKEKLNHISGLALKLNQLNYDYSYLNEKHTDCESRYSLVIEENDSINKKNY